MNKSQMIAKAFNSYYISVAQNILIDMNMNISSNNDNT